MNDACSSLAAVDGLTSTEGSRRSRRPAIALVALVLAIVLAVQAAAPALRPARRARATPASGDLVEHAARLEQGFVELRDWVEDTAAGIERRMAAAEERIDGCVAYRSLVRYDAYGEMSGPPVQLARAARRPPLGRGPLVDPPPRERARVREAA